MKGYELAFVGRGGDRDMVVIHCNEGNKEIIKGALLLIGYACVGELQK